MWWIGWLRFFQQNKEDTFLKGKFYYTCGKILLHLCPKHFITLVPKIYYTCGFYCTCAQNLLHLWILLHLCPEFITLVDFITLVPKILLHLWILLHLCPLLHLWPQQGKSLTWHNRHKSRSLLKNIDSPKIRINSTFFLLK